MIQAVVVITKGDQENYEMYLQRVRANPLARVVKLADLSHNSDITRLVKPTAKDFARIEKYQRAIKYLQS